MGFGDGGNVIKTSLIVSFPFSINALPFPFDTAHGMRDFLARGCSVWLIWVALLCGGGGYHARTKRSDMQH